MANRGFVVAVGIAVEKVFLTCAVDVGRSCLDVPCSNEEDSGCE